MQALLSCSAPGARRSLSTYAPLLGGGAQGSVYGPNACGSRGAVSANRRFRGGMRFPAINLL